MSCGAGVKRVQGEYLAAFPRATYDAGCYNPNSRLDGGGLSAHAKKPARAADIGIKPAHRGRNSTGQRIFLDLIAKANRIGLKQAIYDYQIWSRSNPAIRRYTANPHLDHVHFECDDAHALSASTSVAPVGSAAPKPEDEETELYFLLQGDAPVIWLTNGFVVKRAIGSPPELDAIKKSGVLRGRNDVIKWPQAYIDNIPTLP